MAGRWNPEDTPYVFNLLGPRPEQDATRAWWDAAAEVIEGYRRRWGVTHPGSAFGPPPTDVRQWQDRNTATDQVRAHVQALQGARRRQAWDVPAPSEPGRSGGVTAGAAKLPLKPLIDRLPINDDVAHHHGQGPGRIKQAAIMLNMNVGVLYRYQRMGLDPWAADRLAVKAGLHPLLVWGEAWEAAARAKGLRGPAVERGLA